MVEENREGWRSKGGKGQGAKGRHRILAQVQDWTTAELAGRRGEEGRGGGTEVPGL